MLASPTLASPHPPSSHLTHPFSPAGGKDGTQYHVDKGATNYLVGKIRGETDLAVTPAKAAKFYRQILGQGPA